MRNPSSLQGAVSSRKADEEKQKKKKERLELTQSRGCPFSSYVAGKVVSQQPLSLLPYLPFESKAYLAFLDRIIHWRCSSLSSSERSSSSG